MLSLEASFQSLIAALSGLSGVRAIGKAGGAALPQDGFSDIDLFIFCDQIPSRRDRASLYAARSSLLTVSQYGETEHPHWGLVDSLLLGKQEVYPMFFTKSIFSESVASILRGERTEREDNYFYPTGRCASLLSMHAYFDPYGLIEAWKEACATYPEPLRIALLNRHLPKIDDEEDFLRAIMRGDVLFFHATLDLALDHFLQALFALNMVYFPSRKRTPEYLRSFVKKPDDCEGKLLNVIRLCANPDTLNEAYEIWKTLCLELVGLVEESNYAQK